MPVDINTLNLSQCANLLSSNAGAGLLNISMVAVILSPQALRHLLIRNGIILQDKT